MLCLLGLFKKYFYYYFENELSCTRNVKINKMITAVLALCFVLKLFSLVEFSFISASILQYTIFKQYTK